MITVFQSIVLGLVEGFTEFLPVSSTAHLVLAAQALGITQGDFAKTFEIAIQSGAILAVVVLYWRKFLDVELLKRLVVAFIPTGVLGLIFYKIIKVYLGNTSVILWSLALGGLFLIVFELLFKDRGETVDVKSVTYRQAFLVGLFQSIAMVPGVSRAAATIVGGMTVGIRRETIVEFSFLLAVPTMLAATGLDLLKSYSLFSQAEFSVLGIGLVVSFLTAIVSIKFLLRFVQKHTFIGFGVYRIVLVFLILLLPNFF